MSFRRCLRPLAIALSVGALNAAFLPRSARPTPKTPAVQAIRSNAHVRPTTLGPAPTGRPDLMTWWLPAAELALLAAYLEVAASHWRGLTLGPDGRPKRL
jgi:hypothetical protein